jgi:hypothetical protein
VSDQLCGSCRWAQEVKDGMWKRIDPAWTRVCTNPVRLDPNDRGVTMPVFGRRVPDTFGCVCHQPKVVTT